MPSAPISCSKHLISNQYKLLSINFIISGDLESKDINALVSFVIHNRCLTNFFSLFLMPDNVTEQGWELEVTPLVQLGKAQGSTGLPK